MFEGNHISATLEILTIVILGMFSFITLYERYRKGNNQETIGNFEKTIESMRLRMEEMAIELNEGKKAHQDSLEKIAHLRGENETMKSILLGRDPESTEHKQKTIELLQALVDELKRHDAFVKKAHPEVAD
jgi:FtsZ-binding cell division protein ZapB